VVGALERLASLLGKGQGAHPGGHGQHFSTTSWRRRSKRRFVNNQALDEDPDDRRSFERIQRILSARRDWRSLARAYRRMIRRLGPILRPKSGPGCLACGKGWPTCAGAICATCPPRRPLTKVCVSLAPEDAQHHEALARIYEAQGPAMFRQAVKTREHLLRMSSNADEAAKHVRALANL